MSKSCKRFTDMKRNPANYWMIRDVEVVCRAFGVDCQPPSNKSHYIVSHPSVEGLLPIPARRPIKPIYIMLLIDLIESLEPL